MVARRLPKQTITVNVGLSGIPKSIYRIVHSVAKIKGWYVTIENEKA